MNRCLGQSNVRMQGDVRGEAAGGTTHDPSHKSCTLAAATITVCHTHTSLRSQSWNRSPSSTSSKSA
jgi:hypothetical protein